MKHAATPLSSRAAHSLVVAFGLVLTTLISGCATSVAAPSASSIAPSSPVAKPSTSGSAEAFAKPAASPQAAASASAPAAAASTGTIKISWGQPAAGLGPVWLAQDQGIFKKYGLTTDVVHLAPPADTQAIISGDVQFVIGGSAAIGAMANGADIPFIAVTVPYFVQSLFSQPSIATMTDLAGKKVG